MEAPERSCFSPFCPDGSSANIRISEAGPCDIKDIRIIERYGFAPYLIRRGGYFEKRMRGGRVLVAMDGTSAIGYAAATFTKRLCCISDLAVHPGFRRQGTASQLMACIEEMAKARRIGRMRLVVDITNVAASGLYEKSGFVPVRLLPDYYWGAHGMRMEKNIFRN